MKIKTLYGIFLGLACVLAAASCNKESDPVNPTGNSYGNIVSVAARGEEGATFTFRQMNDSPEITLTTRQVFQDAQVKVGSRIFIDYIPESGQEFESGAVYVKSYQRCYGPEIKTAATSNPSEWGSAGFTLLRAWRSGRWLNLWIMAEMGTAPRRFEMLLNPASENSSEPELHIVYSPDVQNSGFNLPAYGSFNIASLWDRSDVTGLTIKYFDQHGMEQTVHLSKGPSSLTPVE
ncbi:MAG: hypothetical protein K2L96_07735 [Muribaculaceae bacterium]|nr:hypothetical protein [Muribaculaceae bacterium]